jgi:hypothetical protein
MNTGKRDIVWNDNYSSLFSKAKGEFIDIKKYAQLGDTIGLMKEVIAKTLDDTRKLANTLKADTQKETCRNVWNFCFHHLQYEKDEPGIEQVRRPARAWRDRVQGVDCDCMTVFIGSVLTNLGIPFLIRLTKYQADDFEHVYPVALTDSGTIIMDCVVHQFNYEVPYTTKKDIDMKLQYLNGFEDDEDDDFEPMGEAAQYPEREYPEDAEALLWLGEDLEGLEGKAKRQERKAARQEKREDRKEKRQEKKENKPPLKERIKQGLHVINRINPVTALLRAGILASMKLNIGKVAGKLRYAYWTPAQAQANNMENGKHAQLQQIRDKLDKIFFGAGGKPENLKEAIIKGRGNHDKRVALNGLGAIIQPVSDYHDLQTIIGNQAFYEEFDGLHHPGIHGLGEPVSATAAITAASGVIATIAALIKKLGSLFKKGTPEDQKETLADNTADKEEQTRPFSMDKIADLVKKLPTSNSGKQIPMPQDEIADKYAPLTEDGSNLPAVPEPDEKELDTSELDEQEPQADAATGSGAASNLPAITKSAEITAKSEDKKAEKPGVGQWIKDHPVLTAGIVIVGVGGAIMAYKAYQKAQAAKKKNLAGTPSRTAKSSKKSKVARGGIAKVKLL